MLVPSPDLVAPGAGPVDISVIIPTFNYSRFIEECLASVYRQRGVSFEIIVVDDGSSDDTADRIAVHRDRVTYIYQDNQGQATARNTGVRASRGRYLQFLDMDDLLGPDCLAVKLRALRACGPRSVVVCRNKYFSRLEADGTPRTRGYWGMVRNELEIHLLRLNIAPAHAFLLSREAFDAAGGYAETYRGAEDYDFWLRVCGAGFLPYYCPRGQVYYRRHDASSGIKKARKGAYPFDVLVHRLKHEGHYGAGLAAALATPQGAVALCEGALYTAAKIDAGMNSAGITELVMIARAQLTRFIRLSEEFDRELSPAARLNLARIAARRREAARYEDGDLLRLIDEVIARHGGWRGGWRNLRQGFPFVTYEQHALAAALVRQFRERV